MTVSTELSHEEYVGNGITTDFDFRFRIFESRHLIVVVADNDGNETTLKNGTDYTIVGAGSYHGGKVVLNKPLAQGWKILLERDLPVVQETDLRNQGKFFAEVHEDAFDYLTMLIQKALGTFSLSLRKPTYLSNYYDAKGNRIANLAPPKLGTDAANKDYVDNSIKDIDSKTLRVKDKPIPALPSAEQRRNKQLGFDNEGYPQLLDPAETGSLGYILVDSFEKGAEITTRYQALHFENNGEYYRWDGDIPKTILVNSTPESSGGIGIGKWVGIGDASLRYQLSRNDSNILIAGIPASIIGNREKRIIHATDFGVIDDYYIFDQASKKYVLNQAPTDNYMPIQRAVDSLQPGDVLSFSGMRHIGIGRTIKVLNERVGIISNNRDITQILPNNNFIGTCLVQFGDGTQAYQFAREIGFVSAVGSRGNDISSIEINNTYNFDAIGIKAQCGNSIDRDVAGIDIIDGKHTRILNGNFHNNFAYGIIIRKHSSGLNIYNNAFDESCVSIISLGNILEMNTSGNEFGSAVYNKLNPTKVSKIHIDLRQGNHGRIRINDMFSGGSDTEYHIRWSNVKHMAIDGSFMSAKRFAIAGNESSSSILKISGIFGGNGTQSTTDDPKNGISNPDTTPFCSDIHLSKAYISALSLVNIVSDNKNCIAWIEGTSRSLSLSNLSIANVSCNSLSSVVYAHSTYIKKGQILSSGILYTPTSTVITHLISDRIINTNSVSYGLLPYDGASHGDIVCINFKSPPPSNSVIITGYVSNSNIITFQIANIGNTNADIKNTEISVSIIKAL